MRECKLAWRVILVCQFLAVPVIAPAGDGALAAPAIAPAGDGVLAAPVIAPAGDGASDALPTVDQVLERYIEAVGGREVLEKLRTCISVGRQVDDRPYRGPVEVIPLAAYSKTPDKWLMALDYSEGARLEAFDGKIGWRHDADGVARDDDLGRSKVAWLLNPQGPLRIRDYFGQMVLTGRVLIGERSAYVVETARETTHYSLCFDAETGLLIRIGYYWHLEDYRDVDGVKLPFRVVRGRKGGSTSYVFDKIEHNGEVDDARFAMPRFQEEPARP